MSYFLVKIKVNRIQESGKNKSVNESYLIQAETFGDAETKIYEYLKDTQAEFRVLSIAFEDVHDIKLNDDYEKFFKLKVKIATDGEKPSYQIFYVQAESITHAIREVGDYFFSNTTFDYEAVSSILSPVLEAFLYEVEV